MNKLFIITGATGHLGNNIVKLLTSKGHKLRVLVMTGDNVHMLPSNIDIVYGNTCDKLGLEALFVGCQDFDTTVINCAAIVAIVNKDKGKVNAVNIGGAKNVIDMCMKYSCKLIHVSSVHAIPAKHGQQVEDCDKYDAALVNGVYAKSKATTTQYVLDCVNSGKLNACVLLPSGIIGIRDYQHNHIISMIEAVLRGKLPAGVVGHYDWVDVEDVAQAVYSATTSGRSGNSYIISGHNKTVRQLLDAVCKSANIKPIKTMLPLWFARSVAPLCESYYKTMKKVPMFTQYSMSVLDSHDNFCHSKATQELDYHPRSFETTIENTVRWLIDCKGVTIPDRIMLVRPSSTRRQLRAMTRKPGKPKQ